MNLRRVLLAAAALWPVLVPLAARAALFGAEGLDPGFCRAVPLRQTVVYVDDTMMVDGRTDWAIALDTKLKGSLAPGERVTVVRLSPTEGRSAELWSGCWPDYSAADRARLAGEHFFFTRSPLDALADQQRFFQRDFGAALTRIYLAGKRPAAEVRVNAADPPTKQILRALASDDGRFTVSRATVRAIIFSDMAENSDLGSVFHSASAAPASYGRELDAFLRQGVFYAYGVGDDVRGDPRVAEAARGFWSAALRSMSAAVANMGADLNLPDVVPDAARSFPVELEFNGQHLDGRLSLLLGPGGDLVDSWLGISRLGSAVLTGSFRCVGAGADAACRLDAATGGGIATNSPRESVTLSGREGPGMLGKLGLRSSANLFTLRTTAAEE